MGSPTITEIIIPNSKLVLSCIAQGIDLHVGSLTISQYSADSDAISSDELTLGTMLIGANGDGIFTSNGEQGTTMTIKLLPGNTQAKILKELLQLQKSGTASIVVNGMLNQLDSKETQTFKNGFFLTKVPIVERGKGSVGMEIFKIQFAQEEYVGL